jgi:type I restriction enzyme S subunit
MNMTNWKTYKLCEVANLSTGFPFDGQKYTKEGLRVVRGDNITIGALRWDADKDKRWNETFSRAKEFSLQEGDIVIGMDGSRVGRNRAQIKVSDLPLLLAQRVACIRHNSQTLQKFLYYQIFSNRFENYIKSVHTGTSIPHVSLKQIGDFSFQVPDLFTQQRITNILSALDDKIELNHRINKNLEQQAQALFKSWFVDFEPFQDGKFVNSELGMIPERWKAGNLEELVEVKYGKDHKKLASGTIPVYGSGGIMRYVDQYLYNEESVLIPRKGSLNNVMYVNHPFWTVDTMFYTHMKIEGIAKFIYLLISPKDLLSMNSGSAVPSMTVDILNKIAVIIPPTTILQQFESIVKPLFIMAESLQKENYRLAHLRDTLLPKLMSGELKINDLSI